MTVLISGFALPDRHFLDLLRTEPNLAAATQSFGRSLVSALESAGHAVHSVSVEPIPDYPHSRRLVVPAQAFPARELPGESAGFLNVTGLKHMTRFQSVARALARRAVIERPEGILVHGLNSAMLYAAIRVGQRYSVPVVAVITDAPSISTAFDNRMKLGLKRVDLHLLRRALARIDGAVVVSETLGAELVGSDTPTMLLEGFAPSLPKRATVWAKAPTVVYAGTLKPEYGVNALVAAAEHYADGWRLEVYGRGPAEAVVREAAGRSDRIRYGGVLRPREIATVCRSASVLVNPRPTSTPLAERAFPSKLLEYLATGTPVVTTRLPTVPPEWDNFLNWADESPEGLASAIQRVTANEGSWHAAAEKAAAGQRAVQLSHGLAAQGARLSEFLLGLRPRSRALPDRGRKASRGIESIGHGSL